MNIQAEKEEVIKLFEKVNDQSLIRAIKNLLDFGLSKQRDVELEESINRGLKESAQGKTMPHKEVMKEIRSHYEA